MESPPRITLTTSAVIYFALSTTTHRLLTEWEATSYDAGGEDVSMVVVREVLVDQEERRIDDQDHAASDHDAVEEKQQGGAVYCGRQG